MSRTLRRALTALCVLMVVAYAAPSLMGDIETRYLYLPLAGPLSPFADSLALTRERISLTSGDGTMLVGIVVPVTDTAAYWVLFLHGTGGNVAVPTLQALYARLHGHNLNVFAIDYRGYGESDMRTPSETGLYADARAAYDWLRTVRQIPPARIVIYGRSLGSGLATELATHVQAAALAIEGAFTSAPDVGAYRYPWLPMHFFVRQQFANIDKIGRVTMPTLVMHASDDAEIPFSQGKRLFAATRAPKHWVELAGGHNSARGDMDSLAAFIEHIRP